jgi:hypothetical protein
MFSRFSSLLVYIVAGLAIATAATPMGPPKDYDDGAKAPSYPGSSYSPPKYSADKSYAKPYAEEEPCPKDKYPKEKYPKKYPEDKYSKDKYAEKYPKDEYPEDKYPKEERLEEKDAKDKYPDDKYPKDKYAEKYPKDKYPEDKYPKEERLEEKDAKDKYPKEKRPEEKYAKQKNYPRAPAFPGPKPGLGKLNSYDARPQNANNCNVGSQMCCNPVNRSDNEDSEFQGILAGLGLMGDMGDITQRLRNSDKFIGKNCSPDDGATGSQCTASAMCCEHDTFVGVCLTASVLTGSDIFNIIRMVYWPLAARTSISSSPSMQADDRVPRLGCAAWSFMTRTPFFSFYASTLFSVHTHAFIAHFVCIGTILFL